MDSHNKEKTVSWLFYLYNVNPYIDGLAQDCSNSSALAPELLQVLH